MSNLPKGKQWIAHDGRRARDRRRRQQHAIEAKRRKAIAGLPVDANGRTPAGLIVPGFEPLRRL